MKILIADDDKTSLSILEAVLSKWGYETIKAVDGIAAFNALSGNDSPRIAVLDWIMPGMDGVEVCREIKALNPSVYIILLTSRDDDSAISTALLEGADDFLSKPFDRQELRARLEVGKRMVLLYSKLSDANNDLKKYADEMESLAKERASQLIHAERLSSLGLLTAGIAHEINNPATFISSNLSDLEKFWAIAGNYVSDCPEKNPDYEKLMFISREMPEIIKGIRMGILRISSIVSGLKSFSRTDSSNEKEVFNLYDAIDEALLLCGNELRYNVSVEKKYYDKDIYLYGDSRKIGQVFVNIFTNAADSMKSVKEGLLEILTEKKGDNVEIRVSDNGHGFSEEALNKIWTPFFTTKPVGKGTGLGMSVSLGIIQSHNGKISVCNRDTGGAEFRIVLPLHGR